MLAVMIYRLRRVKSSSRKVSVEPGSVSLFQYIKPDLSGLSEKEAASKMPAYDRAQLAKEDNQRFLRQAIRVNLLSTFNIDIFAIAVVMLLLGSPTSTLGTMFVLFLNVTINTAQVMLTRKRLNQIMETLRPQATVLREGKLRSIDPFQIVTGDLLVVGSGDQILVNGEMVSRRECNGRRA